MALEKHTHLPLESVFHRSMESLHICSFSDYLWHNQYKNEIFLFLKYLLNLGPLPQSCLAKRHLHNKRKVSSVEGTPCPWKCDMKHRACHSGYVKATWHLLTMLLTLAIPQKRHSIRCSMKRVRAAAQFEQVVTLFIPVQPRNSKTHAPAATKTSYCNSLPIEFPYRAFLTRTVSVVCHQCVGHGDRAAVITLQPPSMVLHIQAKKSLPKQSVAQIRSPLVAKLYFLKIPSSLHLN